MIRQALVTVSQQHHCHSTGTLSITSELRLEPMTKPVQVTSKTTGWVYVCSPVTTTLVTAVLNEDIPRPKPKGPSVPLELQARTPSSALSALDRLDHVAKENLQSESLGSHPTSRLTHNSSPGRRAPVYHTWPQEPCTPHTAALYVLTWVR